MSELKPNEAVNIATSSTTSSVSIFDKFSDVLTSNPYFNAGAGLAGMGLAMSALRKFTIIANTFLRRKFIISLEINNQDPSYQWLLDFVNRKSATQTRKLSVATKISQTESGKTAVDVSYTPGHGQHFFVYNYRWIKVERQREKHTVQQAGGNRIPFETVTLSTLGTDPMFLQSMLKNATFDGVANAQTGLVIYQAIGPQWVRFGTPRRKRDINSVVLDQRLADELLLDLQQFFDSSSWYAERGVPYRRGYLFYGPPGTGKSSFISALASHFGYSVCMLSLSERTLDDDRLNHLINTAPPNSIIILEDIDAAFSSRDDPLNNHPAYQGLARVTLSGLLNAIDGVGSAEERVIFMTTNYIQKLDKALIRPGRIDVKQYFGNLTEIMIQKMFKRFYGDEATEELSEKLLRKVKELKTEISPASLQGHFLLYKYSPKEAIENIDNLLSTIR
ncbi:unnamed protein product [Auanema sp. JU1783]|nr:unnamed protein product [Auanema sp. JU1783]